MNPHIIKELERELTIFKKLYQPIRQLDTETYNKLYVEIKDLYIVDLLEERYNYGFNIEYDLARLFEKPIDIKFEITEELPNKTYINLTENTSIVTFDDFKYDKELLEFVTIEDIKKYVLITNIKDVKFNDLFFIKKLKNT